MGGLVRSPGHRNPSVKATRVACAAATGIAQGMAEVTAVDRGSASLSLELQFPDAALRGIALGASVAVNGTCLSVVGVDAADARRARFDVVGETLQRTTLGTLRGGERVNYERAASMGDEIGGHAVSGHVHTTAVVRRLDRDAGDENVRLTLALDDARWIKYILPKGFVAVDGCSLTVGEVSADAFTAYLIPETLR